MTRFLIVAAGGALGAVARYGVGVWAQRLFPAAQWPWATLTVNIVGSAIMGLLVGLMAHFWSPSAEMRAFLTVGVLGGFTTFSAFSFDIVGLTQRGALGAARLGRTRLIDNLSVTR